MRRYSLHAAAIAALLVVFGAGSYALAGGTTKWSENLIGYQEVPAISTQASGTFTADVASDEQSGLESDATQAHIHFGQRGVVGGISVWLCSNLASPPTPTGFDEPCGLRSDTISGTATAADVRGPSGQGISAMEFAELLRAMRAGVAYANVHSMTFLSGEIRAQLDDNNQSD
jgi:hypothetical protein